MINILNLFAFIFAVLAAYYWFASTRVKLPDEYRMTVVIPRQMPLGGNPIGVKHTGIGYSSDFDNLANGLKIQSKLNSKASLCAGVAAFCQGLVFFIPLVKGFMD